MREFSKSDIEQIDVYYNQIRTEFLGELPMNELERIKKALMVAYDGHYGQMRKNKVDPYIVHPIAVAKIVRNEIGFGTDSVICALLHDVVEDSGGLYTVKDIENLFGPHIAAVVDGLTKITSQSNKIGSEQQEILSAEQLFSLQKVIMNSSNDIRVIYIKIADRLHNMRTLDGLGANSKLRKAGENTFFYSPFAARLGLYKIKQELEDASFKITNPQDYHVISRMIEDVETARDDAFENIKHKIEEKLKSEKIPIRVEYFRKSVYSVWKKMDKNQKPLDEIHNYRSIRIIFDSPSDKSMERRMVYMIYAEITNIFQTQKDSLRDFIKLEKKNGFEAIVFDIMAKPPLEFVEIQILSERMRMINDHGPLSLKNSPSGLEKIYKNNWIKRLHEDLSSNSVDAWEFLKEITTSFSNEIVVFAPDGKPIRLSKGSTVLDFAFHIHTEMGLKCMGATVDKFYVPVSYQLHSGQRVKIDQAEIPVIHEFWIDYVKTRKAADAIKDFFKKKRQEVSILGRETFNSIISDAGIRNKTKAAENLQQIYKMSSEELFFRLGEKIISQEDIYRKLINPHSKGTQSFFRNIFKFTNEKENIPITKVEIDPKKSFLLDERQIYNNYFLAQCCNPVPGDNAVIFQNKHGVYMIHQTQCPQAKEFLAVHGKKAVPVEWMNQSLNIFPAKINVKGVDRPGLIRDIAQEISNNENNLNMHSINVTIQNQTRFLGDIILFVKNKEVLDYLINKVRHIKGVDKCLREYNFEML